MNEETVISEINALKTENRELRGMLAEIINHITDNNELYTTLLNGIAAQSKQLLKQTERINDLYQWLDNLPYEILDPKIKDKYVFPKIMTEEETIDEIVLNKKSISRFGDGEFGIMFGCSRWRFQKVDDRLAERLREVVTSNEENILIGLINFYGSLSHRSAGDALAIRSYITPEVRAQHMELLDTERIYANTGISRSGTAEKVKNQKRIWNDKECVFIEGDKTRMGVGNDLFNNAKSIQRILCPSESAFDNYDSILEEALKLPLNKTILIALGPTASVLAYDLAKAGYHAIDIGHTDLSYEWFLRSGGSQVAAVNYKYNNEWPDGYIVEDIHDEKYESEIIADLSK